MKKQEIQNGDWKYLIILDACRYDIFKAIYNDYLKGKLEKRESRGSSTGEWLHRTFREKMRDVTYISANPYINSKGITLDKVSRKCNVFWNPKEHFQKIIDVWDFGWDEEKRTVPPHKVNKAVEENLENLERAIIHYMQPHGPPLSLEVGSWKRTRNGTKGMHVNIPSYRWEVLNEITKLVPREIAKLIPREPYWKIKELLSIKPKGLFECGVRLKGDKFYYYKDNLRRVLTEVSKLIDKLHGKIVITADHGEAFGEQGEWQHPYGSDNPVLIEVPWLPINNKKAEIIRSIEERKGNQSLPLFDLHACI